MADVLTIEDDDGFATTWAWPEDLTMLANAAFVELCVQQHDALRAAGESDPSRAP